jgi:hypothetical protein
MPQNDSLFDIVERFEKVLKDLELIIHGDKSSRYPGLVEEFSRSQVRLGNVETELAGLKRRRHNVPLWVAGFTSFVTFIVLLGVALVNFASAANLFDIPAPLAAGLAAFFVVAALILFLGGFGWIGGQ